MMGVLGLTCIAFEICWHHSIRTRSKKMITKRRIALNTAKFFLLLSFFPCSYGVVLAYLCNKILCVIFFFFFWPCSYRVVLANPENYTCCCTRTPIIVYSWKMGGYHRCGRYHKYTVNLHVWSFNFF